MKTLAERFMAKLPTDRDPAKCWDWQASLNGPGYGQISAGRRGEGLLMAHRVSYEMFVGPIPEGLHLDHLCRNPRCVNPEHLEPVTSWENLLRGTHRVASAVRRDICQRGHAFSENAYTNPKSGRRHCRECRRFMRAQRRAAA